MVYVNKMFDYPFQEYEEAIDEEYWAGKIGSTYEDYEDGKWVLLTEKQAAFHNANPEASVREVLEGDSLAYAKEKKIAEIEAYDSSENVNCFYINGNPMWLTVDERQQIATQISANDAVGRESMTKWFEGVEYTFPLATWKQMLVAVEVYAGDALNVTEAHKAAVSALTTIKAVNAFDVTADYPEKLQF